jgi:DNA-binding NarL/FixJ family response regulator
MEAKNINTPVVLQLLIVDDHKMVRDGLRVMLSSFKNHLPLHIEEAENGEHALKKINKKDYDLVIMDYHMPGLSGSETILRILRFKPETKILALSNYDELACIQSMLDAGAKGYILKNIDPPQMLSAIRSVLENKTYFSNEVATQLLEADKKERIRALWQLNELTKRETEVLKMIAMELTNEEIAEKLSIGKRTVDAHRQNLLRKLHAKNTVGLIKAAYKLNLINQ